VACRWTKIIPKSSQSVLRLKICHPRRPSYHWATPKHWVSVVVRRPSTSHWTPLVPLGAWRICLRNLRGECLRQNPSIIALAWPIKCQHRVITTRHPSFAMAKQVDVVVDLPTPPMPEAPRWMFFTPFNPAIIACVVGLSILCSMSNTTSRPFHLVGFKAGLQETLALYAGLNPSSIWMCRTLFVTDRVKQHHKVAPQLFIDQRF